MSFNKGVRTEPYLREYCPDHRRREATPDSVVIEGEISKLGLKILDEKVGEDLLIDSGFLSPENRRKWQNQVFGPHRDFSRSDAPKN
jgi:hypothetical protein